MAHKHSVYDTDLHFKIDSLTRGITNLSKDKTVIVQHDHNSERFTFEIPRYVDGHDMSLCNAVQVHYLNIEAAKKDNKNAGIYEVEDLQISPDSDDVVVLSWLISGNATKYVGSLNFVIRFCCVAEDGTVEYAWNTAVFSGISVSTGICNTDVVIEDYSDVFFDWEARVAALERGGSGSGASVKAYGAVGDGATDDTEAFQAALAENRVVSVPGGTYKLSDTLVIRANCCLEMSQDTVLNFINTSGNCIEMRSSAALRGNHGIVNVPYAFTGHVIDIVTTHDTLADTEPYTHWTPMWKRGRYIYDVSIVKANPSGLHYSTDGTCSGTGIYMSGDGNNDVRFIWGALLQGIRIGGAFTRGIHAINFDLAGKEDSAWNHDMRIEAVLHGCETSVDLTNCNGVHLAVAVQPRIAENNAKYAKWGVYLNDCRFVDMATSVIWDWNEQNTLYTSGSEYTAVAMYGKCWGLVYYDYCYHTNGTATRNRIYTDTPSNLEKMTIVQEPITRWFKQVDGVPYYFDGNTDKKLATQEELDTYFDADIVKGFTDVLATATDTDGTVYNGNGYKAGYRLSTDGTLIAGADNTYTVTGFMPITVGQKMYVEGMSLASVDDSCRFCLYDSNKKIVQFVAGTLVKTGTNYYIDYEETENGFWIVPNSVSNNNGTAYIRFNIFTRMIGDRPMIAVDEEIKYKVEGFLADGVKVKDDAIVLTSPSGKGFRLTVSDNGTITTAAI